MATRQTAGARASNVGYNHARGASRPTPLHELRLAAGLSLRDLETVSGVNRAILSQIERGRLSASSREAGLIAAALGLPAGSLVTRTMLVHEELS